MARVTAPSGDEARIRVIVFKEGDVYVAQCLEYDIAAQASDIAGVIDRLNVTIETEFESCACASKLPRDCIQPAPNYYHGLWETRSVNLSRLNMPAPTDNVVVEIALAA